MKPLTAIGYCILVAWFGLAARIDSSHSSKLVVDHQTSILIDRLRAISGSEAIDCGKTSFTNPDLSVSSCGERVFQEHKPFFLAYMRDGILAPGYGLVRDAEGNVFEVSYQGFPALPAIAPNRHTWLADNNHTRITKCINPVTLGKDQLSMLWCITPVNQQESDKVAHQKPLETTVCAILENPAAWNNKLVRARGHYSGNFEYSMLGGDGCKDALWFDYAGNSGPPSLAAYVRGGGNPGSEDADGKLILPTPVTLVRDSKLSRFEKQVEAMARADDASYRNNPDNFVSHCVTATFTGRIDAVSSEIHDFRKNHPDQEHSDFLGFGQMGMFEGQLILQSIDDDAALGVCE